VFGNFYRRFVVRKIARARLHKLYGRVVEMLGVFESVLETKFNTRQIGNRIPLKIDLFVVHIVIDGIPLIHGVSNPVHFLMQALRPDIARDKCADCDHDS